MSTAPSAVPAHAIQLVLGTVYTQLKPVPIRVAQMLEDRLRYLHPDATGFNPSYASGRWDGFVRLYERQYGRFPTGLLIRVKRILDAEGIPYEVKVNLPEMPATIERTYCPEWDLRPYQLEAVHEALKRRRGVISVPTGGGKTEIAQAIVHESGVSKVLFLVPSKALLRQTVRRMRKAFPDTEVFQWGDNKRPPLVLPDSYILVATVQSAFKSAHPMLVNAGMVFVDESHHQSAETFKTCTKMCIHARYLYGLSATPFRSDGADLELEAWLGPIIYSVSYEHLIKNGWLVPPEFHTVYTLKEALELTRGKRTLLFSEKWEDITAMKETFENHKVIMLNGKSPGIPEWLDRLTAGDVTHIVATPMFDEGLDIPDIEAIVNFATCGSRTRVQQRIGRGMRPGFTLKGDAKTKVMVVDLLDDKYGDRIEAYRKEPAFASRL